MLPGAELNDFNEFLGEVASKTGFGAALFIVSRSDKIVKIKIKASDALVSSIARHPLSRPGTRKQMV